LANVLVHVIYSTKNREPFLRDVGLRRGLEGYLAGTLEGIECPALGLRAVADHMHALCRLSRTVSLAKLVETMKTESSKWIKRHSRGSAGFQWQSGIRGFFRERIEREPSATVHRDPGRTSPREDVPRRTARVLPASPDRIRRTLRLGLNPAALWA